MHFFNLVGNEYIAEIRNVLQIRFQILYSDNDAEMNDVAMYFSKSVLNTRQHEHTAGNKESK